MNYATPAVNRLVEEELTSLRAASAAIHRILISAQRELEMMRRARAAAERYQREIEKKARSQTQLLVMQTRLSAKKQLEELKNAFSEELRNEKAELRRMLIEELAKEIAELKPQANEQIQTVLSDIRMIRITAHEELQTQRKLFDAAKIDALSLASR